MRYRKSVNKEKKFKDLKLKMMVKAGALYYAIFISFLVALLGGFFVMNVWTHHAHTLLILNGQRLERNLHSSLLLAQETPELIPDNKSVEVDLFNDGNDIVSVTRKQWGGFSLVRVDAEAKFINKSAIALYGKDVFENEKIALYLSDRGQYLSLSGKTIIKGDCFLPKSGLRRAYIEGSSFQGSKLSEGKVSESKPELPSENNTIITTNIPYFSCQISLNDTLADIALLFRSDTIRQSFYSKTLVMYSKYWVTLSDKFLQGNIRIISSKGVTITKSVQTDNIIVYAPKIEVGKGFVGNLQLFASDTIIVNDGVKLLFPSLLSIPDAQNAKAFINIGKNCLIIGDLLLSIKNETKNSRAECLLNAGSIVTGRVYCEGRLELRGTVNGTIYTNGFILRTPGSIYENHLIDATINFDALPEYYSGSLINGIVERYKMVKWLI
jgi:hypothetical protein